MQILSVKAAPTSGFNNESEFSAQRGSGKCLKGVVTPELKFVITSSSKSHSMLESKCLEVSNRVCRFEILIGVSGTLGSD